mgnify:CR=1 FL=1|jgi:molybdate transport system substrate-binding protein
MAVLVARSLVDTLAGTLLVGLICFAALTLRSYPANSQTIEILAAASTTEAVTAIAAAFRADTGMVLRPTFAGSSTLAKHIAAGAPGHLFLSANLAWVTFLAEQDLLTDHGRVDLLGNELVVLHRNGEPGLASISDLPTALGGDRLVMGDPAHVPAGRYGRQALGRLDLWTRVKHRAVFGASVRAALALLARGQGAYGIAYATDARAHGKLAIAARFPPSTHAPIIYPLAVIKSGDSALARRAFDYLQGAAAKRIFQKFGFTFLPKPR